MAYVTIMPACLDGNHAECEGTENIPEQIDGEDVICGGGHCICECHFPADRKPKAEWIEETRQMALRSRAARS